MAKFKGSVYESTRAFVKHEFGDEGLTRVLASMSRDDRELLSSVTAIAWVPIEPVMRFHHAIEREFGSGDGAMCTRAGRFSAGWAMNSVLKMFVRLRSPQWLFEKAASVWSRHHDTGRWELDPQAPYRISGRLVDFGVRDPMFCARLRGWVQGAIELTGGNAAEAIEPRCKCRGHEHCSILATWRP